MDDPEFVCANEKDHPAGCKRPRLSQVEHDNGVPLVLKCPICGHEETDRDYSFRLTMLEASGS